MEMHLVVVRPFGGLARGAIVADATRVSDILKSEHKHDVVRVVTPAPSAAKES